MADLAKEESAKEVENVIINSGIKFRSYSTLGSVSYTHLTLPTNREV